MFYPYDVLKPIRSIAISDILAEIAYKVLMIKIGSGSATDNTSNLKSREHPTLRRCCVELPTLLRKPMRLWVIVFV